MPRTNSGTPLLDAMQAEFLAGPVSINVASHDADRVPSVARAYGCRVAADRHEVFLFMPQRRAQAVLRDLAAGAPIAAVFSRPKTHQTLQLKSARCRVVPLQARDREGMRAWGAVFAAEIISLGYPPDFAHTLTSPVEDEAVGIAFSPEAVFEQSPGPNAGMRLQPNP